MSDQLNNSQNQFLQNLIAYEQAKLVQFNREQEERRKKEQELQEKQTQLKVQEDLQKKIKAENLVKANVERERLVSEYLNQNSHIEDDGIDGRMTRQLISHGRKSKQSITNRVNSNKYLQEHNQAQRDELYEQENKRWWESSNF